MCVALFGTGLHDTLKAGNLDAKEIAKAKSGQVGPPSFPCVFPFLACDNTCRVLS